MGRGDRMSKKIRRSMLFLNTQRAALVKDAFVFKPDCVILDLEDAVAENEKDSARIQLYHTLKEVDYQGVERWVRTNALDTDLYHEDIRASVAGGADGIRIPKAESAEDVHIFEELILQAERDFGRPEGSTMIMAALESPLAIINAYEIASASPRMMGIAFSAGDFSRTMQATRTEHGLELLTARAQLLMAARAAGVMAFDTVYTDVNNEEGFRKEAQLIKDMGYDGKSLISPAQIELVHDVYSPSEKEIEKAVAIIESIEEQKDEGVGVFVVNGQMVDIAFVEGAQRTLELAKVSGTYKGDLV